ncbi:MAG TPA: c-type cytochrome [Pirellulales bacterium]|nr:c-type cytochrome [Pirellulales bacterium]
MLHAPNKAAPIAPFANWPLGICLPLAVCLVMLEGPPASAQTAGDSQVPQWIWTTTKPGTTALQAAFFRRSFDAARTVRRADVVALADDRMTIYLNGRKLGDVEGAKNLVRIDVADSIVKGTNLLAIEANNAAGEAGVLARLEIVYDDGTSSRLSSDTTWLVSATEQPDWRLPEFDDSQWEKAASFGRLGVAPWGDPTGEIDDYNQWKQALGGGAMDPTLIAAPPDFEVELVYRAREGQGSWISLDFDPRGRLIVAREDKGLLRMTLPTDRDDETLVETIDDTLEECRGVLCAYGDLYVNANNSKGYYRLRDSDGDDRYDQTERLMFTQGGVGHGRNDLALGPDGLIYLMHGNNVRLPGEILPGASPLAHYGEDRLLPCDWDGALFDGDVAAPAGHLLRTDRDGKNVELVAGGFRNAYGIDFNADGELFTYDSDMEWDVGAPWYRPTRVDHLVSGGDYGYRQGTKMWPAYLPDGLPPSVDIGKGSPTGVKFGTKSRFPPPYRRALFILDWAYGRIFAVHLTPRGASYDCRAELFLKGRPLNMTDLDFGPDGAMYFVVGGRRTQSALYRVRYVGPEVAEAAAASAEAARLAQAAEARALRRRLEALHGRQESHAVETAWPHLDADDVWIRHAARVAIEHQPLEAWQERALAEPRPTAALVALMALARVGAAEARPKVLERLASLAFHELSPEQRLLALRTYALVFIRLGPATQAEAADLAERLGLALPSASVEVNQELCELLVYLGAADVVAKTLPLIPAAKTQEERLHYLFVLRHARRGWTLDARRSYFEWLARPEAFAGAHYMPLFLHNIRNDALATLDSREREALAPLLAALDRRPAAHAPLVAANRAFVWEWKMADLTDILHQVGRGRNYDRGRTLFTEAACSRCHRLAGAGTAVGPDLDGVGSRFGVRDLLETIVVPSKFVDEKYRDVLIETKGGQVITGRILGGDEVKLVVAVDPLDPSRIETVAKYEIESQTAALVSSMPAGLLNTLSREEVLDLVAYVAAGGVRNHPSFRP